MVYTGCTRCYIGIWCCRRSYIGFVVSVITSIASGTCAFVWCRAPGSRHQYSCRFSAMAFALALARSAWVACLLCSLMLAHRLALGLRQAGQVTGSRTIDPASVAASLHTVSQGSSGKTLGCTKLNDVVSRYVEFNEVS
jgi:hypothetical protein